jgi:uncharacterized delta-60 repeat protein/RHS repeat-associated protein
MPFRFLSLKSWLRRLSQKKQAARTSCKSRSRWFRPEIESLEERLAPATITYDFSELGNHPPQNGTQLNNSQNFSAGGVVVTATGYTYPGNTQTALYSSFQGAGSDENGLGIAAESQHEINPTYYVQLDLSKIITKFGSSVPMQVKIGSVQKDGFDLYASSQGARGTTAFFHGDSSSDNKFVTLTMGSNTFLSVSGTSNSNNEDVLLTALQVTVPDPPSNASVCACCPPPCIGNLVQTIQGIAAAVRNAFAWFSSNPVRYSDGVVRFSWQDLSSDGFGTSWGQTRDWTNGAYATSTWNGSGMVDTNMPYLIQSGTSIAVVTSGNDAYWFDLVGGNYVPRYFDQNTLTHSGTLFTFTDTTGAQVQFNDFSNSVLINQQGSFQAYIDQAGNLTQVTAHTADGKIGEVQRTQTVSGTTYTESYLYTYDTTIGDANYGLLTNVTLRRQINGGAWSTVRQVAYAYYLDTDSYGNLGDLKSAIVKDASGNALDTTFYRYYKQGDAHGYAHGLKYVFGPESYARAVAAGVDPASATDAQVAPYADNYFEYDSSQRVTKEVAQGAGCSCSSDGGQGAYLYSYTASANSPGFNSWAMKTVETLSDGTVNTVYTNAYGEVMLKVVHDVTSGNNFDTLYRYDSAGRLIETANRSAMLGYSDTYADLTNNLSSTYVSAGSGLIQTMDYYASTSSTISSTVAGGVLGYLQDDKIQQGQSGTPILQDSQNYFKVTGTEGAGATIYPVANQSVYRNVNPVITDFGSADMANAMVVQSDGKIIVAGIGSTSDGRFVLARYNADGSLDTSFGTAGTGLVATLIGTTGADDIRALALTSSGQIIAVGNAWDSAHNSYDFAVARYTTGGVLDTTFGTNNSGWVLTPFVASSKNAVANSVVIQSDGKIVVAGYATNTAGNPDFAVARYTSAGVLDTSTFNSGGVNGAPGTQVTDFSGGNDTGYSVAMDGSNIVVAGVAAVGSENEIALARYTSAGAIDTTFGSSGKKMQTIGSTDDEARALLVSSGKYIVAGFSNQGGTVDFAILRFSSNGNIDTTFGDGVHGWTLTNFGGTGAYGAGLVLSGTQYVVAGQSLEGSNWDFALARYNSNGTRDTTYGSGGLVLTPIGTGDAVGTVAAVVGSQVLVAGFALDGGNYDFATARYNSDGSLDTTFGLHAQTTSYSYQFFANTVQMQSETDTLPVISSAQNGPGVADVETTFFDTYGRETWHKDADGFIQYFAYDPATSALVKEIDDVDTTKTGDFTGLPTGWTTPSGGGLHLITALVVDALGRTTKLTKPAGNVTYIVYIDTNYEVLTYEGWSTVTNMPTGPTQVTREDRPGSYVETFTMTATPHLTNGAPDGTEAVSGLQTLSRTHTSAGGQVDTVDDYFNLSGITYSTTTLHLGTLNTNYYTTTFGYDDRGWQNRTLTPNGTIYRTVYDGLGRVLSTWVGTNDTPTSGEWSPTNNGAPCNMVQVTANVYDNGGVGDSNLTQVTQMPGGSAANRVCQYFFDWRDRLVASKCGVQGTEDSTTNRPIVYTTYDNLDEVTSTSQYDGDGVTITSTSGVPNAPSASLLRACSTSEYDDQGRVFKSHVFSVDPTSGAVSSTSLTTSTWYDHRGDVIKTQAPGGLVTKDSYDGAGRLSTEYSSDGGGDSTWADATNVTGDNVLEQQEFTFDANSNVIIAIDRQRFHDETATGALGNPTTGPKARVYYSTNYYDLADRLTASVNVGTNQGNAYSRPPTEPARSDTVLVTDYGYNAMGLVQDVTDPKGLISRTLYDALGRTTTTIADYTNGTPTINSDQTTAYTYDGNDKTLTVTATQVVGTTTSTQTTQYNYGVTTAGGSDVNSNDIVGSVSYPGQTQQDSYKVNALGDVKTFTDRNGTVHAYSYDVLGRLTSDTITAFGNSNIDTTVKRIDTLYDAQGNPYLFTSYSDTAGTQIVNQVQRSFNGLGQLIAEYQSHSGPVNTSTTPKAQYGYTQMAGGVNNSRLISMTYPNGRVLNYNYNTGLDSNISRLSSISDSSATLESYKYLGLDTVVERDHPQPGVNLTYIGTGPGDGGDKYVGLDRFGRVVDQKWTTSGGAVEDEFTYTYDRDGNTLTRNNPLYTSQNNGSHNFDESYTYDNLNRITNFTRGTHTQSWGLDGQGNFGTVTTDGSQITRTVNSQNELQTSTGTGQSNPVYDNGTAGDGNLTTDVNGNKYVFDGWNRLVAVKNSSGTTLVTYSYDALGRRIVGVAGSTTVDFYYDAAWQLLEEQVSGSTTNQYVWSPVYVDAMIERDSSGTRLYVAQDANYNVTSIFDTSGSVKERYVYDPYGQITIYDPTWATVRVSNGVPTSSFAWNYGWQGERANFGLGLMLGRERVYSFQVNTWLQQDPLGFGGGQTNLYAFAGNQPVNRVDPSGKAAAAALSLAAPATTSNPVGWAVAGLVAGPVAGYFLSDWLLPEEPAPLAQALGGPVAGAAVQKIETYIGRPPTPAEIAAQPRSPHGTIKLHPQGYWVVINASGKAVPIEVHGPPDCPKAKDLEGRRHGGEPHDNAIDEYIENLPKGAKDVRKNQAQVNANGKKVSEKQPDVQFTDKDGKRHYVEFNSRTSRSDPARLREHDADAFIETHDLDTGVVKVYPPGWNP